MTTIYHNPRCSKSRATLELLVNHGIEPNIVLYLEQPPDAETLISISHQLGCSISDIIRKGEQDYKLLGLANRNLNEDDLARTVAKNPRLLERPIVLNNGKAAIGRPPENVLPIL
jgi:arsenate reductase